jgi:hypothetical protein
LAIVACFVLWREFSRYAFWDFCNTIDPSATSTPNSVLTHKTDDPRGLTWPPAGLRDCMVRLLMVRQNRDAQGNTEC